MKGISKHDSTILPWTSTGITVGERASDFSIAPVLVFIFPQKIGNHLYRSFHSIHQIGPLKWPQRNWKSTKTFSNRISKNIASTLNSRVEWNWPYQLFFFCRIELWQNWPNNGQKITSCANKRQHVSIFFSTRRSIDLWSTECGTILIKKSALNFVGTQV